MAQFYICYPEGKFKALTFSYDDGRVEDRRLVEIFNRNGLKATFHLNSGLFGVPRPGEERIDPTEISTLYQGHEVACHTYTHPTIERCPLDKVALEVLEDRKFLESYTHAPVQGLSYPNGSYTAEIKKLLPALGIEYSRVVGSSHNFGLPKDWYQWQATCHHNQRLMEHGVEFSKLFKSQYLYLMYVWGHSFEFTRDNNWAVLEEFADLMGQQQDVWFCTNIEFKKYMTAAHQVIFTMDGTAALNPSAYDIWMRVDQTVHCLKPGLNDLSQTAQKEN